MKERPILFNGAMVRAVLDGSKTQTRRVMKQPPCFVNGEVGNVCPYGSIGDRLWVRETFVQGWDIEPVTDCLMQFDDEGNELPKKTWYRATDSHIHWSDDDGWETNVPWKPSIHMPRLASRITLEVTGVRAERLQDISQSDARAEGAPPSHPSIDVVSRKFGYADFPRSWFGQLWEQINGDGSWDENPWVWVVEFRRLEAA